MLRRLAQKRTTLSGLKWQFHASRAISAAVAELIVLASGKTSGTQGWEVSETQALRSYENKITKSSVQLNKNVTQKNSRLIIFNPIIPMVELSEH